MPADTFSRTSGIRTGTATPERPATSLPPFGLREHDVSRNSMSLGKKTVVLFLVLGISFCVGSYAALKMTIFPAFEDFERESSTEAVARVMRTLDAELRALEIMNIEYSAWDETHEYALGRLPQYADDYLDPAYWHSININMMLIFDAAGNQLFAHLGHPTSGGDLEPGEELLEMLGADHPLITHESVSGSKKGLLRTRSGVMQVVSYPILTSEGSGPIAGSLVVGQFLTDRRIAEFGQRATATVSLHSIDEIGAPPRVIQARRILLDSDAAQHFDTDGDIVRGYKTLRDLTGKPVALLEVSEPRRITRIGTRTIRTAMMFLAAASAIFLLAALMFMQRLIAAPVKRLTNQILAIRRTGDLKTNTQVNRSDEVGVLAGEFQQLTSQLNRAREDLEQARDEALAMSKAKSEFLARMSHEIRTPMNGVLGMTELLQCTDLDSKQRRFAETIYGSAESLLQIINDILDISKIEAGKIELDIAPFNLRQLVEECLDMLAELAHSKGLELIGAIPSDAHVFVQGDPVRLRQVLVNLISNAVKFTEEGEIVVRVVEVRRHSDSIEYRFEVEDTGVGIRPDSLKKIFEPFSQEDVSTTRRYGGTGLGLSISKQLIELMDGDIGVESTPGHGCTFWFTAKLKHDREPAQPRAAESLDGKRALVVDDNQSNRESLRHQLESWGVLVEEVRNGAEAISILQERSSSEDPFDVMLLDMNMPEVDGLELARTVRRMSRYRRVPLIMLSSMSGADVDDERGEVGLDAWLTKPVRQSRLLEALISLFSRPGVDTSRDEASRIHRGDDGDTEAGALRVLLADDNKVNLAVAEAMLHALGHDVTLVTNGHEAVEMFRSREFDIVLLDCRMPKMDGYEATRAMREWERRHDRPPTPIIALTANALEGDRERCMASGMDDYLSKPFTIDELADILGSNDRAGEKTDLATAGS